MISILGDYSYTFPQPISLKLKLKDMLEREIDEKYYLSDKMIDYLECKSGNTGNYNRSTAYRPLNEDSNYAWTINTRAGSRPTDNFIKIYEATKKGYAIATEGDSINLEQPNSKTRRGRVGKQVSQTLLTSPQLAVVSYGVATNESQEWQKVPLEEKSRTILANKSNGGVGVIENNLRIRKLTPKECFRLMGVKDEDYEKLSCSNAQKYKQAGNSIVVNVLMAIFKELIKVED